MQRLGEDQLADVGPVGVGGVDEVDTELDGSAYDRRASSRSFGSPQMPWPVIRMAPKPSRYTGPRSMISNVPLCWATVMVATTVSAPAAIPNADDLWLRNRSTSSRVSTGEVVARGQQPG